MEFELFIVQPGCLFGQELRTFAVDIRHGINKYNDGEGYIIVRDKNDNKEEVKLLLNRLFQNVSAAYWEGFRLLGPEIEEKYLAYTKGLKKKAKKIHPRKINLPEIQAYVENGTSTNTGYS